MSAATVSELRPGLVLHLDTTMLREIGGSETNAEIAGDHDRAVEGDHSFLILSVDDGICTAVPLFSNKTPGSSRLDRSKMNGSLPFWKNGTFHYSWWQHWRIPVEAVAAASTIDEATPGDRCLYAENDPAELEKIAAWQAKNRADYRAV